MCIKHLKTVDVHIFQGIFHNTECGQKDILHSDINGFVEAKVARYFIISLNDIDNNLL